MIWQLEPLPPRVHPGAVLRALADGLRPHKRVAVSDAVERHVRIHNPPAYVGPYRNAMAPYLKAPMDRAMSRDVDEIYIVGPSQWGKTQVILGIVAHGIKYRPADILLIQSTENAARDFSKRRIERGLLNVSPDLKEELGEGRSEANTISKVFKNGLMLTLAWPTPSELSSRPVPTILLDERDRMPDNIGGEGDPVALARKRKTTFGRQGVIVAVSSPSRSDHSGIMALYPMGDRNLWFWPCLGCGHFFSPGFGADREPAPLDHLKFDGSSAEAAAATARLVCPSCGFDHEERHKPTLNERADWIPDGCEIDRKGRIHGDPRRTRIASYWGSGLFSPFLPWSEIARNLVNAEADFAESGEEHKLKAVFNTDVGCPYVSRAEKRKRATVDSLRDRAEESYPMGMAPTGVRYITAAVDVHGDRFEVGVRGWSENGESWWLDRFALRQLEDGRTDISPPTHAEHWELLVDRLLLRAYPLEDDPGLCLPIARTAIDTGGEGGTTENAYSFYRTARRRGLADRQIMLIKGASNADAPSLPKKPTFEGASGKKAERSAVPLYVIGVNRLKDAGVNRMHRDEPGPGYMHFPSDFPSRAFDELGGEVKVKGKWERRGPNETFDLEVYTTAARMALEPHKVDWTRPPHWAVPVTRPEELAAGEVRLKLTPPPRRARRGNVLRRGA